MALQQPERISQIAKALPNAPINRAFLDGLYLALEGRKATDKEYARFQGQKVADVSNIVLGQQYSPFAGKTGGGAAKPSASTGPKVPDELANNPYFKQLDPDSQALIAYNWSLLATQNADKIKAFGDALVEAGKQADPYWSEKINIIKDELSRTLGTYDADLASRQAELTRRRDYIQQQLSSGSQFITAEQQAELARQSQQYDTEIHTIGDEMANRGLTSSSINERARSKAAEQNAGVVESINRTAERSLSQLQTGSSADLADIAAQLTDLQRQAIAQKTSLIRGTEAVIGSSALGNLGNDLGLGGITGSLSEEKARDIFTRATALAASRGY